METGKTDRIEAQSGATTDDRRWQRHSIVIPVCVTVNLNGERSSFRGEASDISRGGMRLFLTRELPPGSGLQLEFLIPYNATEVSARGVVRNRDGFTHGIEFLNPSPELQQMIERTCKVFQLLS